MPSEGMGGTEEDFTSWKHGSCQGQLVAAKDVLEMGGGLCVSWCGRKSSAASP